MVYNFECYLCKGNNGEVQFTLDNYPAYIVPLPLDIAPKVVKANLSLHMCLDCGHMQVSQPDEALQKLIYEEYYNYYLVDSSEALVPHYRKPFTDFVNCLIGKGLLPNGELLEIGCSSGENVSFFASFSQNYTGVDPSDRIKTSKEKYKDYKFVQGYFPEAIIESRFDVVISQFNLEHICDVSKFVKNVFDALNDEGVFILQVPDCDYFIDSHQPNFLAHEHIQYFTKNTLVFLLEKFGFSAIDWGERGPSLIGAFRKSGNFNNKPLSVEIQIERVYMHAKLFNLNPGLPKHKVVFYGVGPQLYWLLKYYKGDKDHIIVVDDNPGYEGQGLPGYSAAVQKISPELLKEVPFVVLSLNKIYHEKVMKKLQSFSVPFSVMYILDNKWTIETLN
jgi:SAM-dependent methyltransferase